jgi:hypothetical protein
VNALLLLLVLLLQVIDTAFTGSVSRIGGMNLADLQREAESFWAKVSGWLADCVLFGAGRNSQKQAAGLCAGLCRLQQMPAGCMCTWLLLTLPALLL